MTLEEKIQRLERSVEREKNEVRRLKAEQTEIHRFMREYPEHAWYLEFLKDQVARLERVNDKLQQDFDILLAHDRKQEDILKSFDVVTPSQEI